MTAQQAFALACQHHQAGRLDEAIASYRRALLLSPDKLEAEVNLGAALIGKGQLDEALAAFHRALQLSPHRSEIHNNLGAVLAGQGRTDEAIASYRRALELKPDYAEAQVNLGLALVSREKLGEAIAAFRRALQFNPDNAETHYNLGTALLEQGQFSEAAAAFRGALRLKPDYADAYNNLGSALKDDGELEAALVAYRKAIDLKPANPMFLSNLIFVLPLRPASDVQSIRKEKERWNRLYVEPLRSSWRAHRNDPDPQRRLKVGYVSADFRSHAVSFFLAPLLEAHDRSQFEIHGYASVQRPDATTERLRKSTDVWHDVRNLSDAELAECVRNDGIDILVDLAMHTAGNRLPAFAHRPAPLQISWLAYPGSTGVEAIDYRLTDAHIDPVDLKVAEPGGQLVRLPDAWCCYAPIQEFPLVGPLPAAQKEAVTFGSLNQFSKIHDGLLHCWARLLEAVPRSRLLMVCPEGQPRERTHALFAARGIAKERVELVKPGPWPDYMRLFERIDLALDSFPGNGMTTTCHALWMGLPPVTLAGTTAISRAGKSLLQTIGLPEWVARSEDQYIRIAMEWANHLPRLAELRGTMRARMQASPLMDAPRFARNMETAYRTLWQRWCVENPSTPK